MPMYVCLLSVDLWSANTLFLPDLSPPWLRTKAGRSLARLTHPNVVFHSREEGTSKKKKKELDATQDKERLHADR